ncbi:MAG: 4Fe-4S dicluster domain-containing protein [Candidatus Latescibacteria bacterium]|nr:4Fe-4S dicluster domain-containing protein [Candidatus Latescibacterota bacterium]
MTEKKSRSRFSLPGIRPYIQGFFLLFFLFIFFRVSYPFHEDFSKNFFFNLDPLIALIMAISGSPVKMTLLISLVAVLTTILFGRVFCGWICPMGTIFDLSAYIFYRNKNENKPFGNGRYKNIKYYLLGILIIGSLMGFTAVMFFDPLVFLFRVLALNVHPYIILAANQVLHLIQPLAMKMGMYKLSMMSLEQPVFRLGAANLFLFAAVIGLIAMERRFWCRNLCPLGAFLSLLSRYSMWGRRVSDVCIKCSKCTQTCPMNAISENYMNTSARECIQCERCAPVCPVDAISFRTGGKNQRFEFNPSRRNIIFSGIGGVLASFAAGTAVTGKTVLDKRLRPPGALIEKDFLDACLRCGECMKVCPTHGLQPAMLQAGFEGMFTPVLTPRVGACEEQCNLCGQICPTGAVRPLPLEEKQYAIIGNAIIDRNRCIAWEQGKICLICDEVCPYDAVEFHMVTDEKGTIQRPFVIEDKCVGCGQCENGCPVNGPAAIFVTPVNEVRKNDGSYITDRVKQLREEHKFDDEKDFYEEENMQDSEIQSGENAPKPWETNTQKEGELPPGFVE